jgi:AcrR family transcriptional regulator
MEMKALDDPSEPAAWGDGKYPVDDFLASQEVTPARQARSEATFHALIEAGRRALDGGSFEKISINDVCRAAGTSVGAFYGRFQNKEVFFTAIQQSVIADVWDGIQQMLNELDARDAPAAEFLEVIATFWVRIYRDNRGLYLAAFKHASTRPGVWTPFKKLGWSGSALIAKKLATRLPGGHDDMLVRQAMQFVNSLLVNATINDPGPIHLDDPAMAGHVSHFLCLYLGVQAQTLRAKGRWQAVRKARR